MPIPPTFFISGKAPRTAAPYIYMNIYKKFFLRAKEFFFPGVCALCGGRLNNPAEIRYSLCRDCADSVTPAHGNTNDVSLDSKCNMCGKPLISEIGTCLPCRNGGERSYERLWVLFPYIGKYRKLLTAYKFGKNLALADFFADKISEIIPEIVKNEAPELKNAVIVPVPPRPGKIKETGWDQVEHLVKRLEKIPGCLPVCRCLRRGKSRVQKRLSRAERLENLKGRISVNAASAQVFLGKRADSASGGSTAPSFILIDDVITTGSTIEVCSAVLKEAGAGKIYGICLCFD